MSPPSAAPLRVVVLLDSLALPAWLHRALWDVARSDSAQLVLAVVGASRPARRGWLRAPAFRAYEALDRRFFHFPQDHSAVLDVTPLLEGCARIEAEWAGARAPLQLATAQREAIRAQRPDLILKLGFPAVAGLEDLAPLGVWSFDHLEREAACGAPPFFWELARGATVTETCLRATTAEGSQVLARSFAATDRVSLHRSRNAALWKTADFVARAMRDARSGAPAADTELPAPALRAPDRAPNALDLARCVVRGGAHVLRERRRIRSGEDFLWFVALRDAGAPLADGALDGFHPVQPPDGRFQADPFLLEEDGRHWLFVEDAGLADRKGVIRCSELREDGSLGESRIVLECDYHLSYPFVFRWGGEHYMLPETQENRSIELWRATQFPWRWTLEKVLFHDVAAVDPTLLEHDGRLWLFVNQSASGGSLHDELFLYSAESLHGAWQPHPRNPVVSDVRRARPAGRLFREGGALYRPAQDCGEQYGSGIWIHRVDELSLTDYRETPVRRIGPGWWPGASCTHTLERAGAFDAIDARAWVRRGARLG